MLYIYVSTKRICNEGLSPLLDIAVSLLSNGCDGTQGVSQVKC